MESRFIELMAAWFPSENGGSTPTAYLVDTSEEALLFPDWLKLRMIRCHQRPLVDAALQDLEPAQLLLFVQSFGIPIWSMSKLLDYLDKAVDMDSEAMEQVENENSFKYIEQGVSCPVQGSLYLSKKQEEDTQNLLGSRL